MAFGPAVDRLAASSARMDGFVSGHRAGYSSGFAYGMALGFIGGVVLVLAILALNA